MARERTVTDGRRGLVRNGHWFVAVCHDQNGTNGHDSGVHVPDSVLVSA
jgi:hypothetical protein